MITAADVADITGVVLPLVITPGASFALTVAGAVEGSRWIGARIAIGTAAAISLIAAAVCFTPLAQTLSDSRLARLLAYVGAAVLFALAVRVAYPAIRTRRRPGPHEPGVRSASARAFTATIVNPKALTIYLVIVPGLAASLGQPLRSIGVLFAVVHIICTFGWLTTVDTLIQRARWLGQPRSRRVLQLAAAAGLAITAAILLLTARALPASTHRPHRHHAQQAGRIQASSRVLRVAGCPQQHTTTPAGGNCAPQLHTIAASAQTGSLGRSRQKKSNN